jgi:hypothetical protein
MLSAEFSGRRAYGGFRREAGTYTALVYEFILFMYIIFTVSCDHEDTIL